jgi:hypothetical protein
MGDRHTGTYVFVYATHIAQTQTIAHKHDFVLDDDQRMVGHVDDLLLAPINTAHKIVLTSGVDPNAICLNMHLVTYACRTGRLPLLVTLTLCCIYVAVLVPIGRSAAFDKVRARQH